MDSKVDNSSRDANEDDGDQKDDDADASSNNSELLNEKIIFSSLYQVWRHSMIYGHIFESLCDKKLCNR